MFERRQGIRGQYHGSFVGSSLEIIQISGYAAGMCGKAAPFREGSTSNNSLFERLRLEVPEAEPPAGK